MAYRIIYKEHPRTDDAWCIYPTYDYSHCLVDSIENVTHSLCSLEFESRQSINGSYHWVGSSLSCFLEIELLGVWCFLVVGCVRYVSSADLGIFSVFNIL